MNTDGLRLVVTIIVLNTDKMGIRPLIEACAHCQHMLVGLIHCLHELIKEKAKRKLSNDFPKFCIILKLNYVFKSL